MSLTEFAFWGWALLLGGAGQSGGQAPPTPAGQPRHLLAEPPLGRLDAAEQASLLAAVQVAILLPWGTPVPADTSHLVVQFVPDRSGYITEARVVRGLGPAANEAVLSALRQQHLAPELRNGRYVRVAYRLAIRAPGVGTAAQRREAITRWHRMATRRPGEPDSAFVRRVLPVAYAGHDGHLLAHAWRPSPYGRQLFFSRRSEDGDGTDVFVLDPYRPATYAVQVLPLNNRGSLPNYLAAVFFVDATADGRPELLALLNNYVYERDKESGAGGHATHYYTDVWQYISPGPDGRPRYRHGTAPRYLKELPTAAAVRRALARHQRHKAALRK
ncbi:hypothetical protein Q5H92_17110 [Hymenobacter sp. M29]|uniref:TonB C-terminal domain-containing protein n=1 Tax=Hymenobacter mellowenesis TaxID=3063995 RepID=A0ABT9AEU4_9BACT|nr:energy transducer TonB [Hymenobacter sp. M29]MDO7848088.1 hypothetical protein [Hymenobacter sp. M29]